MLRTFFLIPVVLTCFALVPIRNAFALTPAPSDGYKGWNTAEGSGALFSLTTGGLTTPSPRSTTAATMIVTVAALIVGN